MKVCSNNKYIDYIHVLGENVIEGAIKTFDIPTEKLIMTPFGINDIYDKYKGVKRPIKEKYILSIGRSNRDYDFLINSWNNINCELVIISDKYKKDKLPNNVKIIDTISGEEQYPYIMNAEAIILPIQNPKISSGETVLLGSMSFKKIVIVTKPSVIADTYIINKENGLIINKDEIEFENVINDILDNKYDYIKENARNSYLDNYSRYNMGKKLSQFIK